MGPDVRRSPVLRAKPTEDRAEAVRYLRDVVAGASADLEVAFKVCKRKWGGTQDVPSAIPDAAVITRTLLRMVQDLENPATLELGSGGLFVSHTGHAGQRVASIRIDDELYAALPAETRERIEREAADGA